MRSKLSVNIDHVATLRQSRGTPYPDPADAAVLCQLGGADGITVHPREDRRHIQNRDVEVLKKILQVPLTLEMALTPAMVDFAMEIQPFACTLVPEAREEKTTESGLAVLGREDQLKPLIGQLRQANIFISIFIDAVPEQIAAAHAVGAHTVEIHTGPYALARTPEELNNEFKIVAKMAEYARGLGLSVNAGHGLHYRNTERIAALPTIEWIHTGHSIVSYAVLVGLERAVREMKGILQRAVLDR